MAASNFVACRRRMVSRSEEKERVSTVQTCEAMELLSTRNFHREWVSQTSSGFGRVSRNAATAGKVCTISPREPRRTTRKRGSGMRRLANGIEQGACRVILGIANDGYANSQAIGDSAFGDRVRGIVRSFGMNVGAKEFEQRFDIGFAEQNNVINNANGRDELRASILIEYRAATTL